MKTYVQSSGQLFPKRWSLSNPNRTKSIINKYMVKHYRTPKQATDTTSELPPWNGL